MEYSDEYVFNEDDFCFYLEDGKTKIKDLYSQYKDKPLNTKIEDNNYIITVGNFIYQLESPGNVIFFFPNGDRKEIFISYYKHIKCLLNKYKSYDFFYCKDEEENFIEFKIDDVKKIYPVKKIKISTKKYSNIYSSHNKKINDYPDLNPDNLSLEFEKYLKYPLNIKEVSYFFNYTDERKDLFNYLDLELKNNYTFIPICGPEGIGKTSSILAYCRMKLKKDYFYYNARVFSESLKSNNHEEIQKLLIEELSNCLLSKDLFNSVKKILNFNSYNCGSMEFLIHILENIEIPGFLIIDQYKTALDEEYIFLKELLEKFQNSLNIILLSSMNEDDVKQSVVYGMKKENDNNKTFYLNYLYLSKLAYVSDNYIMLLNEEEKQVLAQFGNLYSIFYQIIEFRKNNNDKFNKSDFLEKMQDNIINNLKSYYKNKDKTEILNILTNLIKIEITQLKRKEFLNLYQNIPFRYVKLTIDNKTIFKISQISDESKYDFQYLYNYFFTIINNFREELFKSIQKDENLSDNVKKEIKPFIFEDNVLTCIKGKGQFNGDTFNNKLNVSSIYNLNPTDIKLIVDTISKIENGDGIILFQNNSKAAFFDAGILIKINENEWKLYLIQITIKKSPDSLITLTFLNDFFAYINAFLKEKCEINITMNYFCYIFDKSSKDMDSIFYCETRKLDYLFYDAKENNLEYPYKNLKIYKMKKKIFELDYNSIYSYEKEFEIEKYYPQEKDFETTKTFLQKKRKLMDNKNFKNETELVKMLEKKKDYYNSLKTNFQKIKNIDYNDKEIEINNYLLDNNKDFSNKNLVGIKICVPDQEECIKKLKDYGLTDIEINNFFNIIEKDKENLVILNIDEILYFLPSFFIPEYHTYIIVIGESKTFYQDYKNKKSYILSKNLEEDFIKTTSEDWKGIAITFIKNISRVKNSIKFIVTKSSK